MGAAGKDSGCNSMRVGLIDVDGHNFPNIPLMKLSAWHKQQGDTVEWYEPLFSGHMNRVYMSKVFSFTQDYPYFVDADEVVRGGSGYCIELTDGREHYQKQRDKNEDVQGNDGVQQRQREGDGLCPVQFRHDH